MTKNDLITKIKAQLKGLLTTKFAEVKAGDLTITSQDEVLVVGSEVFTVDQDGNNIPLGDGEYVLDNGTKIMVAAGKITGIYEKEEEVESEVELQEEMPAATPEDETKKTAEAKPDLAEEMKKMGERLAKCEMMIEKMVSEKAEMEKKIQKMSEMPASEGIEVKPSEFKSMDDKKSGLSLDIMSIREKVRKNNR